MIPAVVFRELAYRDAGGPRLNNGPAYVPGTFASWLQLLEQSRCTAATELCGANAASSLNLRLQRVFAGERFEYLGRYEV